VNTASPGRLGYLLRWLGLTLVVLLGLQLAAVLAPWSWQQEAFVQMVIERLITQAPMALVGLLLVLFGSRLDQTPPRTPLRWLVAALAALLAIALAVAVPVSISGDGVLSAQSEQALAAKRSQLEMAKQQSQNPQVVEQLVRQAEQSGQVPPQATEEQKLQAARGFIDRQLQQMEQQFKEAERANGLALNQRRYAGTGSAAVLAVAFTLVVLAALL
jgi:acyl-CoA synthetase (AMP-forming)/AMP-acid ligase II